MCYPELALIVSSGRDSSSIQVLLPDSSVITQTLLYSHKIKKGSPYRDYLLYLDDAFTGGTIGGVVTETLNFLTPGSWSDSSKGRDNAFHKYGKYYIMGGLGIGFNFNLGKSVTTGYQAGRSYDIDWLYITGLHWGNKLSSFYAGVGMNWRNYRISGSEYFDVSNDILTLKDVNDTYRMEQSNLKMISIQFPLMWQRRCRVWMWDTPLTYSVGPIITVTPWAKVRTKLFEYQKPDHVISINKTVTNQRVFGVDLMGTLKITSYGSFFARYSTLSLMKSGSPVNFQPLSAGFMFGW